MCKIGIVADDLTGATTVGVLLARAGIPTAAFFNEKSLDADKGHVAMVLSSDSRALKKEAAQQKVKSAVAALKEKGAIYFSKRIDTTIRGGIGFEVDAMLEELESDTVAIMVPAMPQSRRIVVGGYSIIDGVALSKTPVANDVRTPVTESHVPTLMAQQTQHTIGMVSLGALLAGKEALKQTLQNERDKGAKVIIVDAITIENVEAIAESVTEMQWNVLAVDPGPFSEKLAIARGFALENHNIGCGEISEDEITGTVLAVAGSATPVTKTQLKALSGKEWAWQVPISAEALIDTKDSAPVEIQRAVSQTLMTVASQKPNVILLETALTCNVLNLPEKEQEFGLQPGHAANNINRGLGEIVAQVLSYELDDIKGIYMTGGDTMVNVLHVLGAKGIELLDYVIPQADLGRIIGGKYDGLVVVGKGGLTGAEDTAISIVKRICKEAAKFKQPEAVQV
ncbi:four-carbon acid sugar kinase family protein [Neobacillus drentensis]|uniref:four-carbon acid sugar kinase family protein n=1 Tax=Neobacillus drentensis TaxID=220684 RepID=UPI002FFF474B